MRKYFSVLLFVFVVMTFYSCKNDNPINVTEYGLPSPSNTPSINQAPLGSLGNYGAGYLNGNIRSDRAIISWNKSNDLNFVCYKIYGKYALYDTFSDPIATITNPAVNTDTIFSLYQNTYYQFKVATITRSGMSTIDTFTIKTPKFLPPSNIVALPSTKGGIKVTWTNNAESASEFNIERTSDGYTYETKGPAVSDSLPAVYSYLDTSVVSSKSYSYRISAKNSFEATKPGYSTSANLLTDGSFESFAAGSTPSEWSGYYSGYPVWTVSSAFSHNGTKSLKSGIMSSSNYSYSYTTLTNVSGQKKVSFYYKTVCPTSSDYFTVSYQINNNGWITLTQVYGTTSSWVYYTGTLPSVTNATIQIMIMYRQASSSSGAAYVDDIVIQ